MRLFLVRYGTPLFVVGMTAACFIFLLGMTFLVEKNDVTAFLIGVAGVIMVFFIIPLGTISLMEIKGIGFLIFVMGIPAILFILLGMFSDFYLWKPSNDIVFNILFAVFLIVLLAAAVIDFPDQYLEFKERFKRS